jgi:hypothetical protein
MIMNSRMWKEAVMAIALRLHIREFRRPGAVVFIILLKVGHRVSFHSLNFYPQALSYVTINL